MTGVENLFIYWPGKHNLGPGRQFQQICHQGTWTGCYRSSRPEVFFKKGIPRNLAKSTGKHLRQSVTCTLIVLFFYLYFNVTSFKKIAGKVNIRSIHFLSTFSFTDKQ